MTELPEPSAALAVLGAVLIEMERRDPGFVEGVRQRIASETVQTNVIRLRGPKTAPAVRKVADEAEAWIGGFCLMADAFRFRKKRA